MRIDRVHVESFLGIHSVNLSLESPVTLIAGPNGSGKSSLKDAIMFCALGETARAPKLKKKDFAELLHPSAKHGQSTLVIDGVTYSRGLPSGNFSTATLDPLKGWEYLLDAAAFLRLGLEERCKELFRVLGIGMDLGSIMEKLMERGYAEPILARMRSFLRQGFAIAAHEAAMIARETKAKWRQITGEDWGAKKGGEWFCVVDEVPPGDTHLPKLRTQVDSLEGQLAGIDGDIGVARQAQATAVQRATEERQAREQAARARQEAERVQRRIVELRAIVAGEEKAKAGQQEAQRALEEAEHAREEAQATVPASGAYTYTCGSCGRTVVLVALATAHSSTEPTKLIEPEDNKRANLRIRIIQAQRAIIDTDTKLRGIETARHVLDELLATQAQPVDPAPTEPEPAPVLEGQPIRALVNLEADRENLATRLQEARTAIRRVEDHQKRVGDAKQRTVDAAALHAEIETWLRLAEDLGPEGIPAQFLHSAIDPINDRLAYSGNSLGFMGLSLMPDMELVGRPEENDPETPRRYELLSESARWRCEAALAVAVGTQLDAVFLPLVLDRFDVLDSPGRRKAIRWFLSLGRQVILLGTLRNRDVPQELPQGLSVHWLQAGELMGE